MWQVYDWYQEDIEKDEPMETDMKIMHWAKYFLLAKTLFHLKKNPINVSQEKSLWNKIQIHIFRVKTMQT